MDGFVELLADLLGEQGFTRGKQVFSEKTNLHLPGYFRATKQWDLVVVDDGRLVAAMELKSHIGSFGNNFNNRTEETLGSAVDFWTAFREKVYQASPRPWLGYLMLLEDSPKSRRPVGVREPHFPALAEFHHASYAERYSLLIDRLVRERHYDAAALVLASEEAGVRGGFEEPSPEYTVRQFVRSLLAHVSAF